VAPPPAVAPPPDRRALTARDRAIDILVNASVSKNPQLRSNAIEALTLAPERLLPVTAKGLTDPNPGVRFAAAVTAGTQRLKSLVEAVRPLTDDREPSVRAAALYSLHILGEPVNITPLADILETGAPRDRANVALLLGLMGDDSAIPLLRRAARTPMPRASSAQTALHRIQVAESIARLGSDEALDALRAGAFSNFDEVRVVAVTAMGAIGDRRSEVMVEHLLGDPPMELQLAAAGALARMGKSTGLPITLELSGHENPVIRYQAAWVLGWMTGPQVLPRLDALLGDSSEMVRVAAAASVLRRAGGP
jgi:HEAT repeat protein